MQYKFCYLLSFDLWTSYLERIIFLIIQGYCTIGTIRWTIVWYGLAIRRHCVWFLIWQAKVSWFLCDSQLGKVKYFFSSFLCLKPNIFHHNLYVIHIKRKVFENIFNTVIDVKGKTKDNIKVKMNISLSCNCKNIELVYDGQ
jgi:hypothetical protein